MTNKDARDIVLAALDSGIRARVTKTGIRFLGPDGRTVGCHFTPSEYRGVRNLRSELRRLGAQV